MADSCRRVSLMCCMLLGFLLLPSTQSTLAAQSKDPKEPERPKLPAAADVNDPMAYFTFGVEALEEKPRKAADAFYWASRLEPTWPEPLYARRIALLLSDKHMLERYLDGDRRTISSKQVRQIDSLQYRALMISPFVYRRLDRVLFTEYLRHLYEEEMRKTGAASYINRSAFDQWVHLHVLNATPEMRAWSAYTVGDFAAAVRYYDAALKGARSRNRSGLHADRARVYVMLNDLARAKADLEAAVANLRAADDKEVVYLYESKALYEHSIAVVLESMQDMQAAKAGYSRALQEDLSFHPAQLGLSRIALAEGDTLAALAAMQLAVDIRPDDPGLRVAYAEALTRAKQLAEAETELRKAIELEPLYPAPYRALAGVLESQGKGKDAADQYKQFLERAPRKDPLRVQAEQRMRALAGDR